MGSSSSSTFANRVELLRTCKDLEFSGQVLNSDTKLRNALFEFKNTTIYETVWEDEIEYDNIVRVLIVLTLNMKSAIEHVKTFIMKNGGVQSVWVRYSVPKHQLLTTERTVRVKPYIRLFEEDEAYSRIAIEWKIVG